MMRAAKLTKRYNGSDLVEVVKFSTRLAFRRGKLLKQQAVALEEVDLMNSVVQVRRRACLCTNTLYQEVYTCNLSSSRACLCTNALYKEVRTCNLSFNCYMFADHCYMFAGKVPPCRAQMLLCASLWRSASGCLNEAPGSISTHAD